MIACFYIFLHVLTKLSPIYAAPRKQEVRHVENSRFTLTAVKSYAILSLVTLFGSWVVYVSNIIDCSITTPSN